MPKLEITSRDTGRGKMVSATDLENQKTGSFFIPDNLPPGIATAAERLFAGFTLLSGEIARVNAVLLPEAIGLHLLKVVPSTLAAPYSGFVDAVLVSARENKRTVTELGAVPPSTVAVAAVRARAVSLYDQAPTIAEKIRLGMTMELPKLQGLVEVEAFSILPDTAQAAIMDRFLILQYASKYGIASKHPAIATPDFPIVTGISEAAVQSEAATMITAIRAHTKAIQNCSRIAKDAILFVSVACSCPVSQAFDLLNNKA